MKERIYDILKRYFPFVIRYGKAVKKRVRRKKLERKKQNGNIITKENLVEDIRKLGIQKGDSLLVHSSLRKLGYVGAGAQTVINALLEVLDESGTLMCPTSTADKLYRYYLEENPVFDVRKSPSLYGAISETFRKMPGVIRSLHPTESVAAKGPLAEYYTKDHFGQSTPYNKNSPYYRLCEKKGKILLLGVDLSVCINLHVVEDYLPEYKPDVYYPEEFRARLIDYEGKELTMSTKVHDPKYAYTRQPNALTPVFEKGGIIKKGKVGEANAMLIEADKMLESMLAIFREQGITMYSPEGNKRNTKD